MSPTKDKLPTYSEVIKRVLASVLGPIPMQDLIDKVQEIRPSRAKNPRRAVANYIRDGKGSLLVRPDPDTVLPIRLAFQGVRFRIRMGRKTITKSQLAVESILRSYLPYNFPIEKIQFVDAMGSAIPFRLKTVTRKIKTAFGGYDQTDLYVDLRQWFRAQKMYHKDHILVTIEDWEKGVFRLEREPASVRDHDLLEERDSLLADIFFGLLEESSRESIFQDTAISTAYALLPDKSGYPPHHWAVILAADGRMISDGRMMIRYSDGKLSPIQYAVKRASGEKLSAPPQKFSKRQEQQVYRFKAKLAFKPRIWRTIEIPGECSLAELDYALRGAFEHDTIDHMGGFWKLVRRGGKKSKRYREVDLGSVNPYGEGEGADSKIAALGLSVGDRLKYVYDFGDWIEHILSLEAIEEPQKGVEYPRQVAQNKPDYASCVECQKKGEETVAIWICITCWQNNDGEILLCEECFNKHGEEHFREKILY